MFSMTRLKHKCSKNTYLMVPRAYSAEGWRTGKRDPEVWNSAELQKAPKGQLWQRAGERRVAPYHKPFFSVIFTSMCKSFRSKQEGTRAQHQLLQPHVFAGFNYHPTALASAKAGWSRHKKTRAIHKWNDANALLLIQTSKERHLTTSASEFASPWK